LYLRAFATPDTATDDDPQVWCFHKETGDPFKTSVVNVAVGQYLYSPIGDSGQRSFRLERKLSDLEDTVAPVWRDLTDGNVDFSHSPTRKILSLFIATLFLRNPQRVEDRRRLYASNVANWEALQRRANVALGDDAASPPPSRSKDEVHGELLSSPEANAELEQTFLEFIETDARPLAERLMRKRWVLVRAPSPTFATSDHPFILTHDNPEMRALSIVDGLLMLPVSPLYMLVMDDRADQPDNCVYPLRPQNGDVANSLVFRNALRFLISSQPSDDVLVGIVKVGEATLADLGQPNAERTLLRTGLLRVRGRLAALARRIAIWLRRRA
jgi:hypothetical protein